VLNATPPLFVLLLSFARGSGEPIGAQKAAGVGLGLAGVIMTIGFASLTDVKATAPLAQFAVLGASLCYALASMWGRRFAHVAEIITAAVSMSCAAAIMLPAALVIERPWTLNPAPIAVIATTILAVLCTAFAMVIYFRLVRTLGPLGVTSGSYLRAGFAVAFGTMLLGEGLTLTNWIGMLLIVLGVIAVTVKPSSRTQKS
jgi:drug/metabolite transporter (DMT)-like permease